MQKTDAIPYNEGRSWNIDILQIKISQVIYPPKTFDYLIHNTF